MSLKKINLHGIGPRLIIWTTVLLTISLMVVSTTVYYLLSTSMRKDDRQTILKMARNYKKIHKDRGGSYLMEIIPADTLVLITDSHGKNIASSQSSFKDHDFDDGELEIILNEISHNPLKTGWQVYLSKEHKAGLIQEIELLLQKIALENQWWSILPLIDNDILEIYSMPLENGSWMKVGRSSEEREEQLLEIKNISLMVILPFIILGLFLSYLLSRSILAPIKDLAKTIRRIKLGENKLRVNVKHSGDEVDLLANEFNALLDHNDRLITNLKSTIDNVAHDLRTPLTRMRSSAEFALSGADDINALKEALQDDFENSDKILALLNAIMDVSEAETQTMKIHPEEINVRELLLGLMDLYQYSAEDKEISFEVTAPLELNIHADRVRITQALGNLIDNALKFSHKGTTVCLEAYESEGNCIIKIQDEGMGIEAQDIERIWDRLYRGDKSRSTTGLGIGLSVVQAIVKAHQGSIFVESIPEKGSVFTISLPRCNASERTL